jgi:hypothetical protein
MKTELLRFNSAVERRYLHEKPDDWDNVIGRSRPAVKKRIERSDAHTT